MSDKANLYNLLKETFLLLDDGDRRLFSDFNLTPPRFYAIFHIGVEPGISSSHLSNRLLCDKSNVTRIVKGLEAQGYVEREPHETDGRMSRLYLTQSGTAIRTQVMAAHQAYNETRFDCIEEIERDNLLYVLARLSESLRAALYPPEPT